MHCFLKEHVGIRAGKDECVLAILLVKVKSSKGGNVINTYVFLDPGSSATFCSESLMQELNIGGRCTNLILRTLGQEKVVPIYTRNGLEVSGLNDEYYYQLQDVLVTDKIITKDNLLQWPYLSAIQVPCIKANIDLLIGSIAPKLQEPWEIINSHGGGPYAVRTMVGLLMILFKAVTILARKLHSLLLL